MIAVNYISLLEVDNLSRWLLVVDVPTTTGEPSLADRPMTSDAPSCDINKKKISIHALLTVSARMPPEF